VADEVDGGGSPPAALAGTKWWTKEVAASDLVAGVFEGGGAKGILYEGALGAMLDRQRPRWFSAVAGSSAGGITAALIAAGLRPEEIARETDAALATLQVDSRWAGLARLRRGHGYISTSSLETWPRQVLREHLGARLGRDDADLVTFIELFDATGIELHVIAVDIDARQPFVFNHRQTPQAEVVLAVLASAAFRSRFRRSAAAATR
jgi:predicted acylesterase/phospholipase RssA